jgi:hypothetical protein
MSKMRGFNAVMQPIICVESSKMQIELPLSLANQGSPALRLIGDKRPKHILVHLIQKIELLGNYMSNFCYITQKVFVSKAIHESFE